MSVNTTLRTLAIIGAAVAVDVGFNGCLVRKHYVLADDRVDIVFTFDDRETLAREMRFAITECSMRSRDDVPCIRERRHLMYTEQQLDSWCPAEIREKLTEALLELKP